MLHRRNFIGLVLAAPLLARPALAASPDIFAIDGVAIRGADPVAFFTDGAATQGKSENALMWRGAYWHFASPENRALFEADPTAYAPQYGGYCAYAMSKGAVATSVPEAWTVYEGKLYLNYSTPVRGIWSQDIPGNIAKADSHWPGILAV